MRWLVALACAASWSFEKDEVGKAPAGFEFATTQKTPAGRWEVVQDGGNKALAQLDKDETSKRYAMAVVKDASFKDLSLSVRGKPVSGEVDQAVGLVWRWQDADNYYVARSNVLEENVRLYRVVKGVRTQIATKENVALKTGEWHTLKVEHRGSKLAVFVGDAKLFEAEDKAIEAAGRVGVWIKADSVTWFDDLSASELK
jgi:hypothetical protein